MALQIVVNQTGKPAGVAGQAREDLDVGTPVTVQAVGGTFLAYQWSFVSKPVDITAETESSALFATPAVATSQIVPVDTAGTYLVRVEVDSGAGIGATEADVAEITFYAGISGNPLYGAPNADPAELPRRLMAFGEQLQHNVPDLIDPLGNPTGWAREWERFKAVLDRMYQAKSWAFGNIALDNTAATRTNSFNVASVNRTGTGAVTVLFTRSMPDGNYTIIFQRPNSAGFVKCQTRTLTGFSCTVLAPDGTTPEDTDFMFDVKYNGGPQ